MLVSAPPTSSFFYQPRTIQSGVCPKTCVCHPSSVSRLRQPVCTHSDHTWKLGVSEPWGTRCCCSVQAAHSSATDCSCLCVTALHDASANKLQTRAAALTCSQLQSKALVEAESDADGDSLLLDDVSLILRHRRQGDVRLPLTQLWRGGWDARFCPMWRVGMDSPGPRTEEQPLFPPLLSSSPCCHGRSHPLSWAWLGKRAGSCKGTTKGAFIKLLCFSKQDFLGLWILMWQTFIRPYCWHWAGSPGWRSPRDWWRCRCSYLHRRWWGGGCGDIHQDHTEARSGPWARAASPVEEQQKHYTADKKCLYNSGGTPSLVSGLQPDLFMSNVITEHHSVSLFTCTWEHSLMHTHLLWTWNSFLKKCPDKKRNELDSGASLWKCWGEKQGREKSPTAAWFNVAG